MKIFETELGTFGDLDLEFNQGKLVVKNNYHVEKAGLTAGIVLELSSDVVLDAIAKAIPGTVDDAIITVIKTALQAVSK